MKSAARPLDWLVSNSSHDHYFQFQIHTLTIKEIRPHFSYLLEF